MTPAQFVILGLVLVVNGCANGPAHQPKAGTKPVPAPPPASNLTFRNVAPESGIRFTPDRSLRPPLDLLQTAGYGGGFLDYDSDGRLDVLLVGNPRCRLYRNAGNGRFVDTTAGSGVDVSGHWMGCASADYDNDGRADLFLSGYRAAALFHNEGGRFRRVPLAFPTDDWGTSAAFLDYDSDGRLDLYVGCYVRFGSGTSRLCEYAGVSAACAPTHYDAQVGHLYRNVLAPATGLVSFREVTAATGLDRAHGKTLGVAPCDFDGDGDTDLYLANDGMPGDLFVNEGGRFIEQGLESGTAFSREGREQAGMGVDWGDLDGDTRPELVVTTFQHEPTSLYFNTGQGRFREEAYPRGIGDATVNRLGFGARFLDPDNDGDLDLLLANGHVQDGIARIQPGVSYAQPAQLFEWTAARFREVLGPGVADIARPIVGRAVATGDFDDDGLVDVLVTNLEGDPLLLRNETAGAGNWLSLRFAGRRSPRDGTGAIVTAVLGGRKIVRYAGTGGGYLSTSDARVHLGLGSAAAVDRLTVRWPHGGEQTWTSLPANRSITLHQEVSR